jgi:hypothetical protein
MGHRSGGFFVRKAGSAACPPPALPRRGRLLSDETSPRGVTGGGAAARRADPHAPACRLQSAWCASTRCTCTRRCPPPRRPPPRPLLAAGAADAAPPLCAGRLHAPWAPHLPALPPPRVRLLRPRRLAGRAALPHLPARVRRRAPGGGKAPLCAFVRSRRHCAARAIVRAQPSASAR